MMMKIAQLDGSDIGDIADCKVLFPNTSFPKSGPDAEWLTLNECAEVVTFLAFDAATQKNESVTPYLNADWATYRQALRDITAHAKWPNLASPAPDGSGGDWPAAPEQNDSGG